MLDCKFTYPLLLEGLILTNNNSTLYNTIIFYQLNEKLIFHTINRLDITYVLSRIRNFMSKLEKIYLKEEKNILCYIKQAIDYSIYYL